MVVAVSSRPKLEESMYDENLNAEQLIDCINILDKYLDYEDVDEAKKVKFVVMKLRGHASILWDGLQVE